MKLLPRPVRFCNCGTVVEQHLEYYACWFKCTFLLAAGPPPTNLSINCKAFGNPKPKCNNILGTSEWEGTEQFDFAWLEKVGPVEEANPIYIHLHPASGQISHTLPPIDRCCKLPPLGFTFDGIDEVRHS